MPYLSTPTVAVSPSQSSLHPHLLSAGNGSGIVSSGSSAVSSRSCSPLLVLLVFSLALSLLFIVHLSIHTAPLSNAALPASSLLSATSHTPTPTALERIRPHALHGPASSLQPQLLFSRSASAAHLDSYAARKRRKEALAKEAAVEMDMRRMYKMSDKLKAQQREREKERNTQPNNNSKGASQQQQPAKRGSPTEQRTTPPATTSQQANIQPAVQKRADKQPG